MKLTTLMAVAMVVCLGLAPAANAGVSDIYVSFSNFGDGSAAENTKVELGIGDMGTAFIWVDQNYQIDTGAFLDVLNSDTSVINFTGSTVFNPDVIIVPDTPFDVRWQSVGGGAVGAGLIDELNGFKVTEGTGILPINADGAPFLDLGYDSTSNAFLFAQVDFTVVGEGTADISLLVGEGLVVDGGVALDPNFGFATVNVEGGVIPEPTTAGLLALGLIGLVSRRRR